MLRPMMLRNEYNQSSVIPPPALAIEWGTSPHNDKLHFLFPMKTLCCIGAILPCLVNKAFTASTLAGLLCLGLTGCCTSPAASAQAKAPKRTYSSFDIPAQGAGKEAIVAGTIDFQNADVEQVLAIYQELSGRTVVRGPMPRPQISLRSQTPLTRVEALQLLDTVLAQNGITMVLSGETVVKAVPQAQAVVECPPNITLPLEKLPDSSSIMSRTVQLKNVKAVEVMPVLQPFTKIPNALLPIGSSNQLVIRDYSSNVKYMLRMLQDLEKNSGR
jgi:type II secretory pathway component GspD/PulD (secretin)